MESFTFSDSCSKSVVLANDNTVAKREGSPGTAAVMSQQEMLPNLVYSISIDEYKRPDDIDYPDSLSIGIISKNPEEVDAETISYNSPQVVCLNNNGLFISGDGYEREMLGSRLKRSRRGDLVGVGIDPYGHVSLYEGGQKTAIFALNTPQPCHFFCLMGDCVRQITALPVKMLF